MINLLRTVAVGAEPVTGAVLSVVMWIKIGRFASLSVLLSLMMAQFVRAQTEPTFRDDFSGPQLDITKWKLASWGSADSKPGVNQGTYVPKNVGLSGGVLRILVTQTFGPDGITSKGGAIQSRDKFGFGTYDFVMRMTSTATAPDGQGKVKSGGISSGFLYLPNSETEIDIEFLGDKNDVWMTNWHNPTPHLPPTPAMKVSSEVKGHDLGSGFHKYSLVWSSASVSWYIDGQEVVEHRDHVPQHPATIIIQHRGTNSDKWGGFASPEAARYMYVKSVSFTPESR